MDETGYRLAKSLWKGAGQESQRGLNMGCAIWLGLNECDNVHQTKKVKAEQAERLCCPKTQRCKITSFGW